MALTKNKMASIDLENSATSMQFMKWHCCFKQSDQCYRNSVVPLNTETTVLHSIPVDLNKSKLQIVQVNTETNTSYWIIVGKKRRQLVFMSTVGQLGLQCKWVKHAVFHLTYGNKMT